MNAKTAYRLVVGFAVLCALMLTLRHIDVPRLAKIVKGADWALLAMAAVLVLAPLAVRSARTAFLLQRTGYTKVPFPSTAAVTVFGFALSSLTPGGSGDLVRVAALRPYGVGARESATIVVYERGMDVVVMLALLGFALMATLTLPFLASAAIVASALAALLIVLIWWWRPPSAAWLERILPRFARRVLPRTETTEALAARQTAFSALALTALIMGLEALRPWLVIRAVGLDVGLLGAWAIFTLALLAGLVTLLPLGVGSWETAAVWAFGLYGFDATEGAAATVLLRAGVTLPALLVGAVAFVGLRRQLRANAQAEPG